MYPTSKPEPGARGRWTCDPVGGYPGVAGTPIRCNQCRGCRLRRCGEWVQRCWWELKDPRHDGEACFITLTFRDDDLPDNYSVGIKDMQQFMMELRRQIVLRMKAGLLPKKYDRKGRLTAGVRFYAVGEYGDSEGGTKRPHYHFIIFGWQPHDLEACNPSGRGLPQSRSAFVGGIEDEREQPDKSGIWKYGRVRFGEVTPSTIAYVAGYVFDQLGGDAGKAEYSNRQHPVTGEICKVRAPFNHMSRMPGIGQGWYEENARHDARADFVHVPTKGRDHGAFLQAPAFHGRPNVASRPKIGMPGYVLRQRIKAMTEEEAFAFKLERRAKALEEAKKQADDNTPARLLTRHAAKLLGASGLSRSGGDAAQIGAAVDAMCMDAGLLAEAERNGTAAAQRESASEAQAVRRRARKASRAAEVVTLEHRRSEYRAWAVTVVRRWRWNRREATP
jgi:hypothetical protein